MAFRIPRESKTPTLVVLVILAASAAASAATIVPAGTVSGTWSAEGSPYVVQGDIEIPDGATLLIEPGVTVEFEDGAELLANGTLTAVGTEEEVILFTSAQASPSPGNWDELEIRSDSSVLAWIEIEFAFTGLRITESDPSVSDCVVRSAEYTGIRVAARAYGCGGSRAEPTIERCTVELTSGDGVVFLGYGSGSVGCSIPKTGIVGGTLSDCTVRFNTGAGIVIKATEGYRANGLARPDVIGCEIYDNGADGILVTGDDPTSPTISGSQVYSNGQAGIVRESQLGTVTITDSELRQNAGAGLRNSFFSTIASGNWIFDNSSDGVVTSQMRRFTGNTVFGNGDDSDFVYLDTFDQMAPLNDWGTTDPAIIESHIWDGLDVPARGRVIVDPAADLMVTPESVHVFSGQPGGPFFPGLSAFTVWNTETGDLDWEIQGAGTWLEVTPSSDTLSPLDAVSVVVETTTEAESLAVGTHEATLSFLNTTSGSGNTQRAVQLQVMERVLAFSGASSDGVHPWVETVAVSPDGAHVFALCGDILSVLARDDVSGELSLLEEHEDDVGGVDGLRSASSVESSPDGETVYVTGRTDNAIAVFYRNQETGALTFLELHKDGVGDVDGLYEPRSAIVSPDGAHVYVAGRRDDAVAVFSRDSSTGGLTYVEVLKDGVNGVEGLIDACSVALSPGGTHLYVATCGSGSQGADALTVFERDPTTGALSHIETHRDGVDGIDGLTGESHVAISPAGVHVYVTGLYDHAVALFVRDPSTGRLTLSRVYERSASGDGLSGPSGLAVSSDGAYVYVSSHYDDALMVFSRDTASGELRYVEIHRDGIDGVDGLEVAQAVAVSLDGDHVYVISGADQMIAQFTQISALPADLSITKSDSVDPVAAGGAFDYTLSVVNTGPNTAWGVRVEDPLPPGVSLSGATGEGWTCEEDGGLIVCSRDNLDVGEAPAITLSVTAPLQGTGVSNTALVSATSHDPNTANNSASEDTSLLPTVAINDVSVAEGDTGTVDAVFTVTLSFASGQEVTVDFSTTDGTANEGTDYESGSGTVTIPVGNTNGTISIPVYGDTADEVDETFLVTLSNPTNATLADAQGLATIMDNDPHEIFADGFETGDCTEWSMEVP